MKYESLSFTDRELSSLVNALYCAKETFERDSQVAVKDSQSLADQFKNQARQCEDLIEKIERVS